MVQLNFLDPTGDGIPYSPSLDKTVYNSSKPCQGCGAHINPPQALTTDLCQGCSRRKAAKQVSSRMAGR